LKCSIKWIMYILKKKLHIKIENLIVKKINQ